MSPEVSIYEQIGLMVVTASITTLVTVFIKERFEKKTTTNGDGPNGKMTCQIHALMDNRMTELNKAFETFEKDIKALAECYHSMDKKLEVFMAKDGQRLKTIEDGMQILNRWLSKIRPTRPGDYSLDHEDEGR